MIPNHKRPNLRQQKFIVRAINLLGYEPFNKPIIAGGEQEDAGIQRPDRASAQVWALYPQAMAILIRYGYKGWWRYTVWIEEVA